MAGNTRDKIVGGSYQSTSGITPVNWYFENPAGSDIQMELYQIEVVSTGPCRVQFHSGLSSYDGGTTLTPTNPTFALSNYTAVVVEKHGGTPTGGTAEHAEGYVDRGLPYSERSLSVLPAGTHFLVKVIPEVEENAITSINLRAYWKELPV